MIQEAGALEKLCDELRERGTFVIDTEFLRESSYRPRLCLVQIGTRDAIHLIDPLELPHVDPLLELMLDPSIEKVVHSGEQDMEIFFAMRREPPRNVIDVQVAAALLGLGESISYARLVQEVLGVRLSKVETFTDWSRRPLTSSQLEYARDDVRYLYGLRDHLIDRLEELGRRDWLHEELLQYEEPGCYVRDPGSLFRKVKGSQRLDPRQLGVLRELAAWREEEAERLDWPRGRVIADESLLELARRAPRTLDSVAAVRGVHPQLLRRSGQEILDRVQRGLLVDEALLPQPLERRADDEELALVVDLLEIVLRARAAEARIAPAYVASRKQLLELARRAATGALSEVGAEPLELLTGWRRRIAGGALLDLLQGRSALSVDPVRARVEVEARRELGDQGEALSGTRLSGPEAEASTS